ncbi:MAG: protein kinase [Acidobacteriota bacterium]
MDTRASVDWQRVADLFDRAVDLSGSERTAWLDTQCGADSTLRREIEELLRAHDDETHVLDRGVSEMTQLLAAEGMEPAPDQWVGGRFRLRREIGRGGMGIVYEAHDARTGRDVALKFLPAAYAHDQHALERLRIEARATSALAHPNLCAVRGLEAADDGRHFLVLTFYRGLTLTHVLRSGPLPAGDAVCIALQAARGLGAAHRAQVVHRDVKPSNLLVTDGGEVRILDFGVAKMLDHATFTQPGDLLGTPRYMAPEQIAGERIDGRADLWSLGALLYEMVAGHSPFAGPNAGALVDAVLFSEPTPLPQVSADLERLILRLLAKNPEQRYADASALIADLQRLDPPAPESCRVVRARVLRGIGSRLRHFGESFAAKRHHEKALGLWRDLDDRAEGAREMVYLGRVELELDEFDRAREHALDATERLNALADGDGSARREHRRALANVADLLGRIALFRGELDEARRHLEESVSISDEIGDDYGVGTVLCHLAWAEELGGRSRRSDELIEQARRHGLGPQRPELDLRIRLIEAMVTAERGAAVRACEMLEDVATEMHGVGRRAGTAMARTVLGIMLTARGRLDAAEAELHKALELNRSLHSPWGIAIAQDAFGRLMLARTVGGDSDDSLDRAEHLGRESLRLRTAIGDRLGIACALECLADVALATELPERAGRLAVGAALLRRQIGSPVPPRSSAETQRRHAALRLHLGDAWLDNAPDEDLDELIAFALRAE